MRMEKRMGNEHVHEIRVDEKLDWGKSFTDSTPVAVIVNLVLPREA